MFIARIYCEKKKMLKNIIISGFILSMCYGCKIKSNVEYLNECSLIDNEFCEFLSDFAVRMCKYGRVNEVNLVMKKSEVNLNDFCTNDARMIEMKLYGNVHFLNECWAECSDSTMIFGVEPICMAFVLGAENSRGVYNLHRSYDKNVIFTLF